MNERIRQIRSMLRRDPEDVFLRYSLAMEYASAKRFDEAVGEFNRCVELDSEYLPAYVEAGKSLRSAGRIDEARDKFIAAMELAALQGQAHVRDFIQQQLDALSGSS